MQVSNPGYVVYTIYGETETFPYSGVHVLVFHILYVFIKGCSLEEQQYSNAERQAVSEGLATAIGTIGTVHLGYNIF